MFNPFFNKALEERFGCRILSIEKEEIFLSFDYTHQINTTYNDITFLLHKFFTHYAPLDDGYFYLCYYWFEYYKSPEYVATNEMKYFIITINKTPTLIEKICEDLNDRKPLLIASTILGIGTAITFASIFYFFIGFFWFMLSILLAERVIISDNGVYDLI